MHTLIMCSLIETFYISPWLCVSYASDFRMEHALFSSATDGLAGDAMVRGPPLSWPRLADSQRSCLPPPSLAMEGLLSALLSIGLPAYEDDYALCRLVSRAFLE